MTARDDAKLDLIARLQQLRCAIGGCAGPSSRRARASRSPLPAPITSASRCGRKHGSRFGTVAIGVANDVQSRIRAYGDVLYAIRGLFDSSNNVTATNSTGSRRRSRLASVTRGHQHFLLHPASRMQGSWRSSARCAPRRAPWSKGCRICHQAPGERPEYLVLTYVEPWGKTSLRGGSTVNADPLRRCGVDRARDSGQIASSSGVTLVRDGNASVSSTLLRLALYRGGRRAGVTRGTAAPLLGNGRVDAARQRDDRRDSFEGDAFPRPAADLRSRKRTRRRLSGGTLLFDSAAPGAAATGTRPAESPDTRDPPPGVADREWRLRIVPRKDPSTSWTKPGSRRSWRPCLPSAPCCSG